MPQHVDVGDRDRTTVDVAAVADPPRWEQAGHRAGGHHRLRGRRPRRTRCSEDDPVARVEVHRGHPGPGSRRPATVPRETLDHPADGREITPTAGGQGSCGSPDRRRSGLRETRAARRTFPGNGSGKRDARERPVRRDPAPVERPGTGSSCGRGAGPGQRLDHHPGLDAVPDEGGEHRPRGGPDDHVAAGGVVALHLGQRAEHPQRPCAADGRARTDHQAAPASGRAARGGSSPVPRRGDRHRGRPDPERRDVGRRGGTARDLTTRGCARTGSAHVTLRRTKVSPGGPRCSRRRGSAAPSTSPGSTRRG